jgi:hypothetical protein
MRVRSDHGFRPAARPAAAILPAIDLNFGDNWEFNIGVGVGVTRGTDHLLVK